MATDLYRLLINRQLPMRDRACESKAVYLTRREAGSYVRNGRRQDDQLKPYRCRFCARWHLGHRHRERLAGGRVTA